MVAVVVGGGATTTAVVVVSAVVVGGGATVTVSGGLVVTGGGSGSVVVVTPAVVVGSATVVVVSPSGVVRVLVGSVSGCVRVTDALVRVLSALLPPPPLPQAPSKKPATAISPRPAALRIGHRLGGGMAEAAIQELADFREREEDDRAE